MTNLTTDDQRDSSSQCSLESVEGPSKFSALTEEEANELAVANYGWALSIARNVALEKKVDYKEDGLDGAALEALVFCSRRFEPDRGVPFRGYARRRIEGACVEITGKPRKKAARLEQSLHDIEFPPMVEKGIAVARTKDLENSLESSSTTRAALRELLLIASLSSFAQQKADEKLPEKMLGFKEMAQKLALLAPLHQEIVYERYWKGASLRGIAEEWEVDSLSVIRDHKEILGFLQKHLSKDKKEGLTPPKVRPALRERAKQLASQAQKQNIEWKGIFSELVKKSTSQQPVSLPAEKSCILEVSSSFANADDLWGELSFSYKRER